MNNEALRLADELERDKWHVPAVVMQAAADELRRLHAENEAIHQAITDPENQPSQFGTVTFAMYEALEAQRDALLEVVDKLEYSFDGYIKRYPEEAEVNAAIKAVEEEA